LGNADTFRIDASTAIFLCLSYMSLHIAFHIFEATLKPISLVSVQLPSMFCSRLNAYFDMVLLHLQPVVSVSTIEGTGEQMVFCAKVKRDLYHWA